MKYILFICILIFLTTGVIGVAQFEQDAFIYKVNQGTTTTVTIPFLSTGSAQTYSLSLTPLTYIQFSSLSTPAVTVSENNGEGTIPIEINPETNGVSISKLILTSSGLTYSIPLVVLSESVGPFVGSAISLLSSSNFDQDGVLNIDTTLYDLRVDASTEITTSTRMALYSLSTGEVVFDKTHDAVLSSSRIQYVETISTNGFQNGKYILVLFTQAGLTTGLSYALVNIGSPISPNYSPISESDYSVYVYLGIIILLLIVLFASLFLKRRPSFTSNKIQIFSKNEFSNKSFSELKSERDALSQAYESQNITRESYDEGISQLDKLIKSNKIKK